MAELDTVTSSSDIKVTECKIIGSNGEVYDLNKPLIWNNIQIYESIYSPVITGSIQLVEGVNLYSILSMHGNEYLLISFSRPGETGRDSSYKRTFRIYSSDLRKPTSSKKQQSYVLRFCSDEMVLSNQRTISRSFKGLSTSDYVYNILDKDLAVNRKRINQRLFEKSQGIRNFILTKYKPFEAINQFAEYSYNENSSPFLFFENRDGYNFISLEKLTEQDPISPPLNYAIATNTRDRTTGPYESANEIKDFEFMQSFDALEAAQRGIFASRLYTLDLVRQKFSTQDYSPVNHIRAQKSLLDNFYPINTATNRLGNAMYEEFTAAPNYCLTNLGQNENSYFVSKRFRVINSDVEKYLLQRKVHLNMLENTKLWVSVPANPNLSVGYVVEFNLPSFAPKQNPSDLIEDPYHSGKYLITNLRHSLIPNMMETVMTLNKNSVAAPFDPANESSAYKTARAY